MNTSMIASGEDFVLPPETSITVPINFTSGEINISVVIIPDGMVEGDHSFFIRINESCFFTVGDIDEIEVIIIDNDSE